MPCRLMKFSQRIELRLFRMLRSGLIGPNFRGAHSPDEKVQVSSVQKYGGYLMEALKRIPKIKP